MLANGIITIVQLKPIDIPRPESFVRRKVVEKAGEPSEVIVVPVMCFGQKFVQLGLELDVGCD